VLMRQCKDHGVLMRQCKDHGVLMRQCKDHGVLIRQCKDHGVLMRQFSLCTATRLTFSPVPASMPPFTPRPSSLPPSGTHRDEDTRTQKHTATYALTTTHHTHSTHRRGDEEVSRAKICGAGQERERKRRVPLLAQQYLAGSWCVCVCVHSRACVCWSARIAATHVLPQRRLHRVSLCACEFV